MPGALATYAYVNAKLRGRIGSLVTAETLDAIARTRNLVEAMRLLGETDFAEVEKAWAATGDLRAGEAALRDREIGLYADLARQVKEPLLSLVLALACRLEVDNLKNAFRLRFDRIARGGDISGKLGYLHRGRIVHAFDIDAVVMADGAGAAEAALAGTPWAAAAREAAPGSNLYPLELALDRAWYRLLLAAVDALPSSDREIARAMTGLEADLRAIGWLLRLRNFGDIGVEDALAAVLPLGGSLDGAAIRAAWARGGAAELLPALLGARFARFRAFLGSGGEGRSRLAAMERILDGILARETRRLLSGYPFTVGVVLAYFHLKHAEIRAVLALLNAKRLGLSEERTRAAL